MAIPTGCSARWAVNEATGLKAPPGSSVRLIPSGADPNLGVWVSLRPIQKSLSHSLLADRELVSHLAQEVRLLFLQM